MSPRDGRQIIERVLEHLNHERALARPFSKEGLNDWYAYVAASDTCAAIIRNWHKPVGFWLARKAAA